MSKMPCGYKAHKKPLPEAICPQQKRMIFLKKGYNPRKKFVHRAKYTGFLGRERIFCATAASLLPH